MAERKKLGDMLIEAGLIDDFQLQSALAHQRNWGGKLGAILIERGHVKEGDVARVIAEKMRIPRVNLFEPEIPEAVVKLIKPVSAKKHNVMPVKKDGGTLVLAMLDPLDLEAMDEIRFVTGLKIQPALALESEINDAIAKYYDGVDVVRKETEAPPHRPFSSGGKMEIIRGSDLTMQKKGDASDAPSILSKEETAQQSLEDQRMRIDALIALLIEKKVIAREELVSMIYHKKMGL